MNKILVPLDFTSSYHNVLHYATSLASKSKAEITFFYVGARRLLKNTKTITYSSQEDVKSFFTFIKDNKLGENVKQTVTMLKQKGITFQLKCVNGTSSRRILKEGRAEDYNLIIMGTDSPGILGNYRKSLATEILEDIQTPMFIVPASNTYSDIDHITYAVDLSEYDPKIIRQVKSIASMFDAKLTIAHINQLGESENAAYIKSLEDTLTATLDYPKVYYKFFDHADILTGIQKLVSSNNSGLLAMINRHEASWKDYFTGKGLTRQMVDGSAVPLLAFKKS